MDRETMIMKERELLKQELQSLKSCQVQYFSLAVVVTGAIFGIAEKCGEKLGPGTAYLLPLLIVLPFWSVFFDKASSITRIVGYMRVLEKLLVDNHFYKYQGWENALRAFRRRESGYRRNILVDWGLMVLRAAGAVFLLIDFRRNHRYWAINWASFFGLGLCALTVAWLRGAQMLIWWIGAVAFILAAIHNGDVLWNLVRGDFSYDERERLWSQLLGT